MEMGASILAVIPLFPSVPATCEPMTERVCRYVKEAHARSRPINMTRGKATPQRSDNLRNGQEDRTDLESPSEMIVLMEKSKSEKDKRLIHPLPEISEANWSIWKRRNRTEDFLPLLRRQRGTKKSAAPISM